MRLALGFCAGGTFELPVESLLTHIVVLGATGSGKTGLLTVLIEELASQGIPTLAVDVKGDLANLAFEDEEWARAAEGEGLTVAKPPRAAVYTPGYCAGRPLKLLPPPVVDPISSAWAAEAILSLTRLSGDRGAQALLSTLLQREKGLTLSSLPALVLKPPPVAPAGIPLESLVPEGARRRLARELAALALDPVVSCFSRGEALDPESPPPVKVVYLAHLPERLRALAVSLLLSDVYRWMTRRGGSGTPRLAVVFDEARGYLPPHPRNPPTKDPLATLVRQGRGFGVSMLLATQNPRDLDYKVLSNVGTWAVGVLRAKQDREAVAEALADIFGVPRGEISSRIAALKPREFLVFATAFKEPVLVRVRHTVTPLKGPVTLDSLASRYGWAGAQAETPELPQRTLSIGQAAGAYRQYLLARGVAAYRFPGRRSRVLREFAAVIDPQTCTVKLLESPPATEPGSPPGVQPALPCPVDVIYAKSEQLLAEALTEKTLVTRRGDKPKPGESAEEFLARIASELEERKRAVSEKYTSRLRALAARAERLSRRKREVSSPLNVLKPLLSRGITGATLLRALESWVKAEEEAAELSARERVLLEEVREVYGRWLRELEKLDRQFEVRVEEVKPQIISLQLEVLWIPEGYRL